MAKKQSEKLVHCRYPKCSKLHDTTELKKEDAVKGGTNSYYHPDCYHTMQTVNKIRDLFFREIDPMMTGKQIGQLVSIVNNMVFSKSIEVDMILFALQYFIKFKPGKLRYPGGIAYIVQDKDMLEAWAKEKRRLIKEKMQAALDDLGKILDAPIELDFGTEDSKFVYKPNKPKSFADILG